MSDIIAKYITDMLRDGGGVAEIQRKALSDMFACVPSQINYVIETRFTPENGYIVESRRGGGGYIRIMYALTDKNFAIMEATKRIGNQINDSAVKALVNYLASCNIITTNDAKIMQSTCSDHALGLVNHADRDCVRACILKCALLGLMENY